MSDLPLALVTGAAKRLGAAMARRLVAEGFRVAIHCNGSRAQAQALAEELGPQARVFVADLSQPQGPRDLWGQVAAWGVVELLVNNASTFHNDDLLAIDGAAFDSHLAVNLKAPVALMEAMAQSGQGQLVVNMIDNKVFAQNPDFFTYSLSKSALLTATEVAAMRLRGRLRVCGIAPSITLMSGAQSEAEFQAVARINPLRRRVAPQDICDALIYLWQDQEITGEVLAIDGGQSLLGLPRDVAFLNPQDWLKEV